MGHPENWTTLTQCPCCGTTCQMPHGWQTQLKIFFSHYPEGVVSSGVRCPIHNRKVGGSPTSSHLMKAIASDVLYYTAAELRLIVIAWAMARIRRLVIYTDRPCVHMDCDQDKPEGVFIYPPPKT